MKRLFNQPNIIIKTIPLSGPQNSHSTQHNTTNGFADKRNGVNKELQTPTPPSISIHAVKPGLTGKIDEGDLLPSKKEGKSEITLLPIKRQAKECDHVETCENIVCDVYVEEYAEEDGESPLLAVSIDDDEIDAPVSKHCKNGQCDALSIDHSRCRRALIKLHRVDRQGCCDICGTRIKTNKARVHHKKCKRKFEYRHNENDGAQILREKMRERELQMIEAAKTKKNDYMHPLTGYNKAMEVLQNNDELIIIPKSTTQQQSPIITITTVPNSQVNSQQFPNMRDVFGSFMGNMPIMFSQQNMIIGKQGTEDRTSPPPAKHARMSENLKNLSGGNLAQMLQNPFIKVSGMSQGNFVQPMTINDWLMSQQVVSTPIQPKPYLTPIRVVPIASLKTQPSLLHQTQGIPRFCIMADNGIRAPTPAQTQQHQQHQHHQPNVIKYRTVQPAGSVDLKSPLNSNDDSSMKAKNKIWKKREARLRKKRSGRMFSCSYCPKRFSTDWYFKMHVARHRGEMLFSCKICEKPFSNKYDIKKHMGKEHKEGEVRCEICGLILPSEADLQKHMKLPTTLMCEECKLVFKSCNAFTEHQKKHGSVVCVQCRIQVPKLRYKKHLLVQHGMSKTKADNECTKMKCPTDCDFANETGEKKSNGVEGEVNLEGNESINDQVTDDQITDQGEIIFGNRGSNGIDSEDDQENDSDDEGVLEINEDEDEEEEAKQENSRVSFECPGCGDEFFTEDDFAEHNNICLRAALKLCKVYKYLI